jgi:C-terminal processing protease CtpA/Prc
LTVLLPGQGGETTIEVPALDLAERQSTQRKPAAKDAAKWTLGFPDDRTALLTMPDWVMYNTKWDWRGFLDATFAEMKDRKATGLVVDLRGNEGGNDCGDEIIARLIDRDLPLETYERRVRYRRVPSELEMYLDTWDPSFKTLGEKAEDVGGGFYRLPVNPENANMIRPKGPRFSGKVIALTDAQNSSATFQFASTIKASRLARLVGEATGGNQRGINGGGFYFLRLPASGLEADLPLIGYFPAGAKPDAGIDPDVAIAPTVADIAAGRDTTLAAALRLAR